jgi:hypothetical protein
MKMHNFTLYCDGGVPQVDVESDNYIVTIGEQNVVIQKFDDNKNHLIIKKEIKIKDVIQMLDKYIESFLMDQ